MVSTLGGVHVPRADSERPVCARFLRPNIVEAAANLKLNRLGAAEKIAQDAEKQPHQTIPQLHILLAEIYLQKREVSNAAAEMRAYLKESPQGPFADSVRKDLTRIGKSAADDHSKPEATAARSKNAP